MDRESELIWEAYSFNPRESDLDIAIDILDQIFSPGGNLDDQYIEAADELDMREYHADEILQAVKIYNDHRRSSSDKIDGSRIIELISGELGGTQDNEYGWDDYEENSEESNDWDSDSIETKLDRLRQLLPSEIDLIDALWQDIRDAVESGISGAREEAI